MTGVREGCWEERKSKRAPQEEELLGEGVERSPQRLNQRGPCYGALGVGGRQQKSRWVDVCCWKDPLRGPQETGNGWCRSLARQSEEG